MVVGFVVLDLVKVERDTDDTGERHGKWWKTISACRDRVWNAIPLTAIKTILVVWQIVTQVRKAYTSVLRSIFFFVCSDPRGVVERLCSCPVFLCPTCFRRSLCVSPTGFRRGQSNSVMVVSTTHPLAM